VRHVSVKGSAAGRRRAIQAAGALALDYKPLEAIDLIDRYLGRHRAIDIELFLLKAHILQMTRQFRKALPLYRAVLKKDPGNPQALIDLGDLFSSSKSGRSRALSYYTRALTSLASGNSHRDAEDELVVATTRKADILLRQRQPLQAIRCLAHTLARYPGEQRIFHCLDQARQQLEQARSRQRRSRA
jgi:tetratricopeptide (TPR) repeat protein